MKIFCASNNTIKKIEKGLTKWEKAFVDYTSNEGLLSRMYKEF